MAASLAMSARGRGATRRRSSCVAVSADELSTGLRARLAKICVSNCRIQRATDIQLQDIDTDTAPRAARNCWTSRNAAKEAQPKAGSPQAQQKAADAKEVEKVPENAPIANALGKKKCQEITR